MNNYLYLIQCNEFFKIGVANNVETRFAMLQTGSPYPMSVQRCYEYENASIVEQCLHQKFDAGRVRGEWFVLNSADLEAFGVLCELLGGQKYSISENALARAEAAGEAAIRKQEERMTTSSIGPAMRHFREMLNLSQRKAAHRAGMSFTWWSELEREGSEGKAPTAPVLFAIAKVLGVSVEELYNWNCEPTTLP